VDGLPPSARLLGIGFYIAFCIILFTVIGKVLDGQFDTGKLFTLVGIALGLVSALYGGVRQLLEVLADMNRRKAGGKRSE
jgi:hypothetical protein